MYYPSYRTTKFGVPVLTKEEIDTIAESYIRDFCPEALEHPLPIDIDSFVLNYLKLKQDFQYLSHCGLYLGMMVFNDTRKVIVYDPQKKRAEYIAEKGGTVVIDNTLLGKGQESRYRFTMGHEGGHWIFHRAAFGNAKDGRSFCGAPDDALVKCRAVSLDGKFKPFSEWNSSDIMEWQANYMASALLMPKSMVMDLYNDEWLKPGIKYNSRRMKVHPLELYIGLVARVFEVSIPAAEIRLRNLGIIKKEEGKKGPLFTGLTLYRHVYNTY